MKIEITVNFPALQNLVDYLDDVKQTQAELAELTAIVKRLNNELQQSSSNLDETLADQVGAEPQPSEMKG